MPAAEAQVTSVPLLDALPEGKPLPLPRFVHEADVCYAIQRDGEEGFTAAVPVETATEIVHDERTHIYPSYEPGHKYTADYHDGAANTLVSVRAGGVVKYGWLDDVLAERRAHSGPVKVTRRAWVPIVQDVLQWEDRQAAQRHGTKPVVAVVGWCPTLDMDPDSPGSLRPHGRVYGVDDRVPSKKYGKGFCARCAASREKQADTRAKIARLRAGEKV